MSEVTSSIGGTLVRASQRLTRGIRRPMSAPVNRMLWLTTMVGLMVLAAGEGTPKESNTTASGLPAELTTTDAPPREAVTDLFAAPLATFKVPVPLSPQLAVEEEGELVGLGKAENNTESTPAPFSNLWFNAGQSLGSAANSLTGWLNSRLGPPVTTTTTKPPEVIVRVQSHKANRKPLISIDPNRNTQGNRISPPENADEDADDDEDEDDDEDADADDEEDYEEDDEEQNAKPKPNRNSNNDEEEDDDDETNDDEEEPESDDEEEEEEPVKKQKQYKKKPTNHRRGYDYDDEEDVEDYDDDEDYDYVRPNKNSARQQQQQSLFNRFRQLAQRPYSSSNKQQNSASQSNNLGYRPVRIIQNGQTIQLVPENRPNQQNNRRKRPSAVQNSYQLIPIRNNQFSNAGQKQRKKPISKPNQAGNLVIPISSQSGQKKPSQYITIPWSQLGLSAPQQDYAQSGQQAAPVIVNLPQMQNPNRRRRPVQNPPQSASTPQRKRLRRPLITYPKNDQVVSLLTDQNIRDIFRVPEIPPSRTPAEENTALILNNKRKRPTKPSEMQMEGITTVKPISANPELEVDDDDSLDDPQPYIVVGDDDDTNDEPLARHAAPKRFLHIGGMKPYVDVLNKRRLYFKSARQMRMDNSDRPETKITTINPEPIAVVDKDVLPALDIATESSSKPLPLLAGLKSDNTSTDGVPEPQ